MATMNFAARCDAFWQWFGTHEEELARLVEDPEVQEEQAVAYLQEGFDLAQLDLHFSLGSHPPELILRGFGFTPEFMVREQLVANKPAEVGKGWVIQPHWPPDPKVLTAADEQGIVFGEGLMWAEYDGPGTSFALQYYHPQLSEEQDYDLVDYLISYVGEAYAQVYLSGVAQVSEPVEGMYPVAELKAHIAAELIARELEPDIPITEHFSWLNRDGGVVGHPYQRYDLHALYTRSVVLAMSYLERTSGAYNYLLEGVGVQAAYLSWPTPMARYSGEQLEADRAEIATRLATAFGSGAGAPGCYFGTGIGYERDYIDLLIYDEDKVRAIIAEVIADYPYAFSLSPFVYDALPEVLSEDSPLDLSGVEALPFTEADFYGEARGEALALIAEIHSAAMADDELLANHLRIIKTLTAFDLSGDDELLGILGRAYNNVESVALGAQTLEQTSAAGRDAWYYYRLAFSYYYLPDYGRATDAILEHMLLDEENIDWDLIGTMLQVYFTRSEIYFRVLSSGLYSPACIARLQEEMNRQLQIDVDYYYEEAGEAIQEHVEKYFGEPSGFMREWVSHYISRDIIVIPPSMDQPFYTLMTLGMGASQMPGVPGDAAREGFGRAELFMLLPPEWAVHGDDEQDYWPVRWLKSVASIPFEMEEWIGWGHLIPDEDGRIANTPFSGVMVSYPYAHGQEAFRCTLPHGEDVCFYQLIPIYENEMAYARAAGSEALEELLGEQSNEYNPYRIVDPGRSDVTEARVTH